MLKNKGNLGFTLAELMIGITIIAILAVGITKLDFNRLSENQNLEIEIVKITNIIEEARNNALIGKGVNVTLDSPDSWSVIIDSTGQSINAQWDIISPAATGVFDNWETVNNFTIRNMRCQHLDGTYDTSTNNIVTINYFGSRLEFDGCDDNTFKKLVFEYGVDDNFKVISMNSVTGVIEID